MKLTFKFSRQLSHQTHRLTTKSEITYYSTKRQQRLKKQQQKMYLEILGFLIISVLGVASGTNSNVYRLEPIQITEEPSIGNWDFFQ